MCVCVCVVLRGLGFRVQGLGLRVWGEGGGGVNRSKGLEGVPIVSIVVPSFLV